MRLGLILAVAIALPGCIPDGQWFTPDGVALGEIDCIGPAPLTGPNAREICKTRLIPETPEAIAECQAQGGTVGPVSVMDGRFSCRWQKAA